MPGYPASNLYKFLPNFITFRNAVCGQFNQISKNGKILHSFRSLVLWVWADWIVFCCWQWQSTFCCWRLHLTFIQDGIAHNVLIWFDALYRAETQIIKYVNSRDLKTEHLKFVNILDPDFLKVGFQMVRFSNGWALALARALVPTIWKVDNLKSWCFCPDFK